MRDVQDPLVRLEDDTRRHMHDQPCEGLAVRLRVKGRGKAPVFPFEPVNLHEYEFDQRRFFANIVFSLTVLEYTVP